MEINEGREIWLSRFNEHLENLLNEAKRDNKLQRHMTSHYLTRDTISQVRLKQVKKRLKEAQMKLKEKENLDLLAKASLVGYPISFRCERTNFESFGAI